LTAGAAAAGFAVAGAHVVNAEQTPRLKGWQERWDKDQLGWHLKSVNPYLQKYFEEMLPEASLGSMGSRVLFPLCGKTVDMAFLAKCGIRVVGVDGVYKALEDFAKEQGVTKEAVPIALPKEIDPNRFKAYATLIPAAPDSEAPPPPVILVEGDFLELGEQEATALVPFEAAFDRGSLVAIDPKDRPRYAQALTRLITPGGRVLLSVVEHDKFANGRFGPPFEVTEPQIRELFEKDFEIRQLAREEKPEDSFIKQRGCTRFAEAQYILIRRGQAPVPKL
jgi:thiopurine S-methyltransferase